MNARVASVFTSRVRVLWVLVLLSSWMTGCVSVGENFAVAEVDNIQNGVTTQQEIRSMFGSPWRTGIEDGKTTWTYGKYHYGVFRAKKATDLVIKFDDKKVVSSFTFSTTEHDH